MKQRLQPRLSKPETARTAARESLAAPFELIFNSFSFIRSKFTEHGRQVVNTYLLLLTC